MYTYIRNAIKGYYIETPDEISQEYWEGYIGSTYDDFLNGMWVPLSDEQVAFHYEYPSASIKEVLDMQLTPEPERTLEQAKSEKIDQIDRYDSSDFVNGFDVVTEDGTITAWLTPSERANYRSSIDAAELLEINELSLYIGDTQITIPTQTAKLMLAQIQLYADRCFIVTKQHKAAVEVLSSIEEVDNYNNVSGYPEKLVFNI